MTNTILSVYRCFLSFLIELAIAWLPVPSDILTQWGYLLSGIATFGIGISAFVGSNLCRRLMGLLV
ncbi:MAG: hypothetical protein ACI8WB_001646 [Phenylobacterium sp.]|jgi:hypothetical protein